MKGRSLLGKSMRDLFLLVVGCIFLLTGSAVFAGGSQEKESDAEAADAGKVWNLKFWHEHQENAYGIDRLIALFNELEERTNGRIVITPYWGESLAPRNESVNALRNGLADIGKFQTMSNPGEFPVCDTASLPFLVLDDWDVTGAYLRLYREGLMPEFEDSGIKVGCFITGGQQYFLFKDKVDSMDDMKGLSVRSQNNVTNELIKNLGGTPVAIGSGDVYMSLERGMIEGALSAPTFMGMMKWYEVA